ncbi:hypothetical protein, partial [Mycobacterium persicum]|uniref:hypothetical protein n=1 Tax=Mycobacterium persicum TaxID=1487726 RepID=UPI003FA3CBD3
PVAVPNRRPAPPLRPAVTVEPVGPAVKSGSARSAVTKGLAGPVVPVVSAGLLVTAAPVESARGA